MDQILDWFRLDGDTPRARITQNPLQLIALVAILWIASFAAYTTFTSFMGERWAAFVILLGAVAVGLHLRDLLIRPATSHE